MFDSCRVFFRQPTLADDEEQRNAVGECRQVRQIVTRFLRKDEARSREDMADASAKKEILTDQDSGDILVRVLNNGKNLFLIDNIVSHDGCAP
jgi:hypothetical protein